MKIRFVVWDVDGTLYSYANMSRRVKDIKKKILEAYFKTDYAKLRPLLEETKRMFASSTLMLLALGCADIDEITKNFEQAARAKDLIKEDKRLIDLFEKTPHIIHIALRNGSTKSTKERLKYLGLGKIKRPKAEFGPFYRVWGAISLLKTAKPNPLVFYFIKVFIFRQFFAKEDFSWKKFKGNWTKQVLFVGDRPEIDLLWAKKMGFNTALISKDSKKYSYVDFYFKQVYDLQRILR